MTMKFSHKFFSKYRKNESILHGIPVNTRSCKTSLFVRENEYHSIGYILLVPRSLQTIRVHMGQSYVFITVFIDHLNLWV